MTLPIDPAEIFAAAVSDAAASAIQESVRTELVKKGFSAVFAAVGEEAAKSIATHLLGPVLNTCLKLLDPTQQKLDVILKQPLQTGIQLANQAIQIKGDHPNDVRLRGDFFSGALQSLETAFSYANSRKMTDECLKIRMAQAAVAKRMNAPGAVQVYLADYSTAMHRRLASDEKALALVQRTAENRENSLAKPQLEVADLLSNYYCFEAEGKSAFRTPEDALSILSFADVDFWEFRPPGTGVFNVVPAPNDPRYGAPIPLQAGMSPDLRKSFDPLDKKVIRLFVERRIPLQTDYRYLFTESGKIARLIVIRIAWSLLEKRIEECRAFDRFWRIAV